MEKGQVKKFILVVNLSVIFVLIAFIYLPGVSITGLGSIFDLQWNTDALFSGIFTYASYVSCSAPGWDCYGSDGGRNTCKSAGCTDSTSCTTPGSTCQYGGTLQTCTVTTTCNQTVVNSEGSCDSNFVCQGIHEVTHAGPSSPGSPACYTSLSFDEVCCSSSTSSSSTTTGSCNPPPCVPTTGQACNTNACGVSGGTVNCDGTCSGSTPALPAGYGSSCTSAPNSCGATNSGAIGCSGTCSATTPANPAGYGSSCTSAPNSCGMTNLGTIGCSGCSATTPSESLCNAAPSVTPSAPTQGDYCGVSSPPIFLSWQFTDPDSGDTQSAYRIQIDNNAGFPSPETDTNSVFSSGTQYSPAGLAYNTTFYWRVMVWDSKGASSAWANGANFTTALHQYPISNFTWTPTTPGELETTQFTDTSQVFGGASKSAWSWTFPDGSPVASTQQNPEVQFSPIGIKQVILNLTDSNGYACSTAKSVNAQLPFPDWQEISPF